MNRQRKRRRVARFLLLLFFLLLGGVALAGLKPSQSTLSLPLTAPKDELAPVPVIASVTAKETKIKVLIDAGHGGKDPGAVGNDGKMEKDYTLSMAKKVYELLKKDPQYEPKLTRQDDVFVELEERAEIANEWNAAVFISIHGNTYSDPSVSGTETYYRYDNSKALAESIHKHVVETLKFRNRAVREGHLRVLTFSSVPSTLVEIGYLTNPKEEARMLSEDGQARAAQAIVDGIRQYVAGLE
ncbi:N-acetylmuramoyl-L-alanine amidase family protein [Paenibacillus koleovorans]|uniref:N-acetylmuramoyl-L-alanine amidase family protein n=1 Tax=Paenibacillus koleovorans TaxID=121608 RepID=UPI000FDA5441|nr:N-acetylmuramoyl-L-alanine amidase [Paenibacillus koleovorans]